MDAHPGAVFCRGASGEASHHGIAAEPQPAGKPCRPRGAAPGPAPCPLRPAAVTGGARTWSLRGSRGAPASSPEGQLPARVFGLRSVPATPLLLSQTCSGAASPSFFLNKKQRAGSSAKGWLCLLPSRGISRFVFCQRLGRQRSHVAC